MDKLIAFWVFDYTQLQNLRNYFPDMAFPDELFITYNGKYYLKQTEANLALYDELFMDYDEEHGDPFDDFAVEEFTWSNLPGELRP